ncbi:MAG: DUF5337 family protein [Rhodosalinus sp.]|uniref:DUF5337 family protein n=1 Tax=Rhodosalinus sp. TaxID=2047741 RepID=UPI00397E282D
MPERREPSEHDRRIARQGRVIALVVAGAGLAAILAPWITASLGLAVRYEMLIYLAAMGAFLWALIAAIGLWRQRTR